MEGVKFDRVVSVNSEIEGHGAKNLLDEDIRPSKNWMCEKGTEKAVVILQLDKPTVFASIHVGNAHSAFVEILVGKAADTNEHFESLLPMSLLMNPQECKSGENKNQTRFFKREDFNETTATKPWDRIKVVCSQPFNRYVPYGLCFLKIQGMKQEKTFDLPTKKDEKEVIQIGSFFRKKRESGGTKPLSVSEQIKQAEKDSSLAAHTPMNISKMSSKLGNKLSPVKKKLEEKKAEKITKGIKDNEGAASESGKEGKETREKRKTKTPTKHDEGRKLSKRKSPDEDSGVSNKRKEKKAKRKEKPFHKLMDDVVLVISGFKNPCRGDIRSMAFQMGARYSADWNSNCTHLVCAYENTPKFHQVKGKGKIVKKDWVEACHKNKKRYPWRRFALDKSDINKPESEEEVDAAEEAELEEEVARTSKAGTSQDEETKMSSPSSGDEYDMATDDDDDDEKDKTGIDTTDYPMPYLPDIFTSKSFFIDPDIKNKRVLERYIVAYNGTVTGTFNENVEFYVTEKGGENVELFRKKVPNIVAIKPSWIWEVKSKLEYVPTTPHLVK